MSSSGCPLVVSAKAMNEGYSQHAIQVFDIQIEIDQQIVLCSIWSPACKEDSINLNQFYFRFSVDHCRPSTSNGYCLG